MGIEITTAATVEYLGEEDRLDYELLCTWYCTRHSEYFGEYPSGGRQTWVEAELIDILVDGELVENEDALIKILGDRASEILDALQDTAIADFEAGE